MTFVPLHKKVIVTTMSYILFLLFFTIALVLVFSLFSTRSIREQGRTNIKENLISKGMVLLQSNSIALKRMAEENAFSDIQQMVRTTVQTDLDIVYGQYIDMDERTWVLEKDEGFVNHNREMKLWLDTLSSPGYNTFGNSDIIEFAAPIASFDKKLGIIRYGISTKQMTKQITKYQERMKGVVIRFVTVFVVLMTIFVIFELHLARKQAADITRPIGKLTKAAQHIRDGHINDPIELEVNDEIGILAESLEEMRKQLQLHTEHLQHLVEEKTDELNTSLKEQLIQANKLVTLGTLVAGVAHEINNPNNSILLSGEQLDEVCKAITPILDQYVDLCGDFRIGETSYNGCRDSLQVSIERIITNSKRIRGIVDNLKNFSKKSNTSGSEMVDVNAVVVNAIDILKSGTKKQNYTLDMDLLSHIPLIHGDSQQLTQVVINLLQNGFQALSSLTGKVSVRTSMNTIEQTITISIRDNGIGMDSETKEKMFDSFFTRKSDTGGTGMGLYVCSQIVHDHNGTISIDSTVGKGTVAQVSLPLPSKKEQYA